MEYRPRLRPLGKDAMAAPDKIREALAQIEREEGCRVLFAVESGSRAWGFASPDSEYDIRFVYAMPLEWYIDLDRRSDTIARELPGDLDCSGWELRKALLLFAGGNLAFNEWLGSPIEYIGRDGIREELRGMIPDFLNIRAALYHYLGIARQASDPVDSEAIPIKRLFSVMRPLVAGLWLDRYRAMPPIDFHELLKLDLIPPVIGRHIGQLLEQKSQAAEAEKIIPPRELIAWLEDACIHLESRAQEITAKRPKDHGKLNDLVRRILLP